MVALLEAIDEGRLDAEVKCVISNHASAPGIEKAKQYGVPVCIIESKMFESKESYEQAIIQTLETAGVELIVLAGYMRILDPKFIQTFSGNIINIHPSLLPDFKGLHAQRQALEAGVSVAGCTVHFVDEGVDSGPIIAQAQVPVEETDTEETLSNRILKEEHKLYPIALQQVIEERRSHR